MAGRGTTSAGAAEQLACWKALTRAASTTDAIARRAGVRYHVAKAALAELVRTGCVERHQGGWRRCHERARLQERLFT
jgi:predicted Rossmann fold nucleotide-binding protein DprA/Smf involved in DNA uptake